MKNLLVLFSAILLLGGCAKPEGEGGKASIKGKVWAEDWDSNFNIIQYQFDAVDEYVYIVYGDDVSYGDRIRTNYKGEFEFKYLRKGDYKIYVYSDKKQTSSSPSEQEAITIDVSITGKKQTVDVGTITIKK